MCKSIIHKYSHWKQPIMFFLLLCMLSGYFCMPVTTQAATKNTSLYVLNEIAAKVDGAVYTRYQYSYTKQGLVKKCTTDLGSYQYEYQNRLLDKLTFTPDSGYHDLNTEVTEYSYDADNQIEKTVETVFYDADQSTSKTTVVYTYNNHQLVKQTVTQDNESYAWTYTYQYNKKGQVSQLLYETAEDFSITIQYTYDKKGNVTKEEMTSNSNGKETSSWFKYKYTYKNGRISKKVETYSAVATDATPVKTVYVYSYKKIKVPKSYQSVIETQQKKMEDNHVLL